MTVTSASLLGRLQRPTDEEAWRRLVELYTPLIRGWLRRNGLVSADNDDLVQEVMTVVVRRVPQFRHSGRTGAFRAWLRTITVNCLRDFWKSKRLRPASGGGSDVVELLNQLEDPTSGMSQVWDREHDEHVGRRLLEMIQPQFQPKTWQAFRRVTLDGVSPDAVAAELGISVNAVFIAKSRVLSRLRQEAEGILED